MDNLEQQFRNFHNNVQNTLRSFPVVAGSIAVNFFQDSFNKQAWIDTSKDKWKPRKDTGKRNKGRAILVKSGRLKRATRVKHASWNNVLVVNDTPYAAAHNDGVNETQTVKGHKRTATRRASTKSSYKAIGNEKRKARKIKINGATHSVKSYSRHMKIPRRRFMGESMALNNRIDREFLRRLTKIVK